VTSGDVRIITDAFIVAYLVIAWCWRAGEGTFSHRLVRPIRPLVDWLGLGQNWSMFTPDPALSGADLQVIVKRRSGGALVWEPPRMDTLSPWRAFRSFRYRGFANSLMSDRSGDCKPALAEYLLRKYDFGDDPAVEIVFTLIDRPIAAPGSAEAAGPPTQSVLDTFVVPGRDA
jgi:hypothetical protein